MSDSSVSITLSLFRVVPAISCGSPSLPNVTAITRTPSWASDFAATSTAVSSLSEVLSIAKTTILLASGRVSVALLSSSLAFFSALLKSTPSLFFEMFCSLALIPLESICSWKSSSTSGYFPNVMILYRTDDEPWVFRISAITDFILMKLSSDFKAVALRANKRSSFSTLTGISEWRKQKEIRRGHSHFQST